MSNPYAPPQGDSDRPHAAAVGDRAGRNFRIAGGVLLLLIGLWSVAGGGCSIVGGHFATKASEITSELSRVAPDAATQRQAKRALDKLAASSWGLIVAGVAILLAGLLCAISGVLLFVNRAKLFALLALGLGAVGELLFFVMVDFNVGGLVKLAIFGFCAFCALQVNPPPKLPPNLAPR